MTGHPTSLAPTEENSAPAMCPYQVHVGPEMDASRPPRRLPTWVRVLLAPVVMFVAALSPVVMALVPDIDARLNALPLPISVAAMILMYALPTLVAWLLVRALMRWVDRRPMRETGWAWSSRSLPALMLGMGVILVLVVATGLVVEAVAPTRPVDAGSITGGWPLWAVIAIALARAFLLQGIPEELIWRGYVMQTLRTPPVVTAYISAGGFAVLHLASQGGQQNLLERLLYLAVPFGFGLLAAALVIRTGSLWSAVGVHGGFHVATTILTLWCGVGEGPVLWVAWGVITTAVAAWLLHRPGHRIDRAA